MVLQQEVVWLLDCLGDVVLKYVRRVSVYNDYHTLKKYLEKGFSTNEAPIVARRQLPFLKQLDNERILSASLFTDPSKQDCYKLAHFLLPGAVALLL